MSRSTSQSVLRADRLGQIEPLGKAITCGPHHLTPSQATCAHP